MRSRPDPVSMSIESSVECGADGCLSHDVMIVRRSALQQESFVMFKAGDPSEVGHIQFSVNECWS